MDWWRRVVNRWILPTDEKDEGFVQVVFKPDIEVKVRISEGSSPAEIKEIVCKAIDLSLSRKVVLR